MNDTTAANSMDQMEAEHLAHIDRIRKETDAEAKRLQDEIDSLKSQIETMAVNRSVGSDGIDPEELANLKMAKESLEGMVNRAFSQIQGRLQHWSTWIDKVDHLKPASRMAAIAAASEVKAIEAALTGQPWNGKVE